MHRFKCQWQWILILAIFCATNAAADGGQTPEYRLLNRATRVADARLQDAQYSWWLSKHDVLLFTLGQNAWTLSRRNDFTGKDTPLPALTHLYNSVGSGEGGLVSPDGRWLLWRGGNYVVYGSTLNGLGPVRWVLQKEAWGDIHWLSDSRHWVEIPHARQEILHRRLIIHSLKEWREPPVSIALPADFPDTWDTMEVSPRKTLLVATRDSLVTGRAVETFWEYQLGAVIVPMHQFRVSLPPDADYGNVAFDRDGKRVAFGLSIAARQNQPPLLGAQDTRPVHHTLWVSELDGSRMHEVGYMDSTAPQSDFSSFGWLPDGKHLWFTSGWYSKAGNYWNTLLYTVPAD